MKMPIDFADEPELERSALVGGKQHWVTVVVIVGKAVESQTDLFEMAHALGLAGAQFALGNDRQE